MPLPDGWEYAQDEEGKIYYIDHNNGTTSYEQPKFPPHPDDVEHVLATLDADGDGNLSVAEAKVLFAQLLGVDYFEVPDDHEDVVWFTTADHDARKAWLMESMTQENVEAVLEATGHVDHVEAAKGPQLQQASLDPNAAVAEVAEDAQVPYRAKVYRRSMG